MKGYGILLIYDVGKLVLKNSEAKKQDKLSEEIKSLYEMYIHYVIYNTVFKSNKFSFKENF